MTTYTSTMDTPVGPFTAVVDGDGAVLASGWTADVEALLPLIHRDLREGAPASKKDLGAVSRAVREYHQGQLSAPDAITVRQHNGVFLTASSA